MARRVRIKDHWAEQRIFTLRSIVAGVLVAACLLTVAGRLFYLQVLKYAYYAELSQGNRVRTEPIPPSRGLILDRHGVVMADNMPAFQLELVREQVGDNAALDATLAHLVAIGLLDPEELPSVRRTILSHRVYESVPVKLAMNDEEMARFALHRYEFTGVDIRPRLSRHYPFGPIAVHALGYVAAISEQDLKRIDPTLYAGTSLIGKLGVEAAYESELHGTPGYREVLVNAAGRPVERVGAYTPKLSVKQPVAGNDLVLSIDMKVQQAAEAALQGKRGAAIAIDPHNGDVIALASTPGFDPNAFARGLTSKQYEALANDIDKPLINRALRGAYPPGSTVKPFFALAALKTGVITPERTIFCPGHFYMPGSAHIFHDWQKKGHGNVDMRHAIMKSCDVYFYTVAERMGIDRMHDFMVQFGFGQPTGIDIPGEKSGIMPSTDWKRHAYKRAAEQVWFPGETISVGIGQGYMQATPIQLAHAVSGIAARGEEWKPRLVTGIRPAGSNVVSAQAPVSETAISSVSADDWTVAIEGMELVTTPGGTAVVAAAGAPYKIAGKTGTAQVFTVQEGQKYNAKQLSDRLLDHALFIAFAPAENPKLAVAIFVENGGHGSSAAAPLARKILDAYLLPEKTS